MAHDNEHLVLRYARYCAHRTRSGIDKDSSTMELTSTQTALGIKMMKMIKKHAKKRTTPSHEELVRLAKVCNPNASDVKTSATVLMAEGVQTLKGSGVMPDDKITEVLGKITENAGKFDNYNDLVESVINELPIDPGAKMVAAAFIGGDE